MSMLSQIENQLVVFWFLKIQDRFFIVCSFHFYYYYFVLVYMDVILVIGNDNVAIQALITQLIDYFIVKDLDPLRYFLSVEVTSTSKQLH